MRNIACAMLLLITTVGASAQTKDASRELPRFHARVQVGGTAGFSNMSNPQALLRPAGAAMFDFRLSQLPLYLETGVGMAWRGFAWEDAHYMDGKDEEERFSVYVPVVLSYHHYVSPEVAIQPFAGGYVGKIITDVDFEGNVSGKTSYGIRLGCGINWKRLYANIGYDIDLNKGRVYLIGDNTKDVSTSSLFVNIGFNLCNDH